MEHVAEEDEGEREGEGESGAADAVAGDAEGEVGLDASCPVEGPLHPASAMATLTRTTIGAALVFIGPRV